MIAHNGKDIDGDLNGKIDNLLNSLYSKSNQEVVCMLKELVPEYQEQKKEKVEEVEK